MPTSNQPRRTLLLTRREAAARPRTVKRFSSARLRRHHCFTPTRSGRMPWEAGRRITSRSISPTPPTPARRLPRSSNGLKAGSSTRSSTNAAISPKAEGGAGSAP